MEHDVPVTEHDISMCCITSMARAASITSATRECYVLGHMHEHARQSHESRHARLQCVRCAAYKLMRC